MKRLVMIAIGALVGACSGEVSPRPQVTSGTIQDLPEYLERLLRADPASNPMLLVQVTGTDDRFVQFNVGEDAVQLDHPLITEQQREREQRVRKALERAGCAPQINVGSDGSRFLDCDLPRSLDELREVTEEVLQSGLDAKAGDTLTFTAVRM